MIARVEISTFSNVFASKMAQVAPVKKVLTNSAAEFLENRVGVEISPALDGEKKFNATLDKFVDPATPE
jgi:hypothetical protein